MAGNDIDISSNKKKPENSPSLFNHENYLVAFAPPQITVPYVCPFLYAQSSTQPNLRKNPSSSPIRNT
jgi:hypothetical protein